MEGGTSNHLDVPVVDGIRSRAESGGSDLGGFRRSGGRIGTSGEWSRQRYRWDNSFEGLVTDLVFIFMCCHNFPPHNSHDMLPNLRSLVGVGCPQTKFSGRE